MYFATAAFSFLLFNFAYYNCILCIPHFCRGGAGGGGGGLSIQPDFEKGGAWQDHNL